MSAYDPKRDDFGVTRVADAQKASGDDAMLIDDQNRISALRRRNFADMADRVIRSPEASTTLMSALLRIADLTPTSGHVAEVPILLQLFCSLN